MLLVSNFFEEGVEIDVVYGMVDVVDITDCLVRVIR
jgi:hypothetical protein